MSLSHLQMTSWFWTPGCCWSLPQQVAASTESELHNLVYCDKFTHPQEIIEAVEGVPVEGVEVCDNVVESEGPDHGTSEELPGRPALANVSWNMTSLLYTLEHIQTFTFVSDRRQ